MTAHVVVPTEPCEEGRRFFGDPDTPLCISTHRLGPNVDRCAGCLWNGTRAQLEQALPVEPIGYQWQSGDVLEHAGEHPDRPRVWRELRP